MNLYCRNNLHVIVVCSLLTTLILLYYILAFILFVWVVTGPWSGSLGAIFSPTECQVRVLGLSVYTKYSYVWVHRQTLPFQEVKFDKGKKEIIVAISDLENMFWISSKICDSSPDCPPYSEGLIKYIQYMTQE